MKTPCHQEALGGKVLGMGFVMRVVTKTVNCELCSQGLNHRQFRALLEEENCTRMKVRWLSLGKVLKIL